MNAQILPDHEKTKILLAAYQKHAAELLAIEEAQQKLTTLLLAILGAGGSFLAGMKVSLLFGPKLGVTVIVVAITIIGLIYTVVRSRARTTTRALLVRCEEALGFYESAVFIPNDTLYGKMACLLIFVHLQSEGDIIMPPVLSLVDVSRQMHVVSSC